MRSRTYRTCTILLMASLTGCNFAERRSESSRPAKCAACSAKLASQTSPNTTGEQGISHSLPGHGITVLPRVTLRASKCQPCESSINTAAPDSSSTAPTAPSSDVPIPPVKPHTMPGKPEVKPETKLPTTLLEAPKPKTLPEQKPVEPMVPKVEPKPPVEVPKTAPPLVPPQPKPAEPLKLNADKLPPLSANVNRASDFKWVAGVVNYSYVTRAWHLRYAPIDAADEFGGSITLIGSEYPYKDGQFVRVEGELISRAHASAPPYRVRKVDPSSGE